MAPATSLQQHAHPATSLQLHKHRSAAALSTTPLKGDNADDALSTTRLRGDNADDYTTPVYIDGQGPFSLNVDTGSALVGVAGNETIGCDLYYDSSACDGGPIKVVYGSGFWSGVVCEATVTLGAYNVTNYKFGAYQKQKAMTTCERTPEDDATSPSHMTQPHNYMQGIVGLTAGEVGLTAGSPPLLEVLFATHADVDPLFGLQCCAVCCGFDRGRGGGGVLDVGGFDSRRFYGAIQWVPVTKLPYWAVRATSIRFGANEVLPADVAAIDAYADGTDQSIVDSGTSGLVLPKRAFEAAVEALSAAAPDVPSAFWKGEACVDASKLDVSALPELTVALATEGDDVVLTMPACRYINRVPKTSYCAAEAPPRKEDAYFFSVGPIEEGRNVILGQSLFESYYVAHDMGASPRVGFAPIRGCDADGCGMPVGSRFEFLGSRWAVVAALVCLPLGAYIRWRNRRRDYAAVESSSV